MAIIKCPECGHLVSDQAKTCPGCGIEIEGKVMKCKECGEVVFSNLDVCPNCHAPLHGEAAAATGSGADGGEAVTVVAQYEPEPPAGGGGQQGGGSPRRRTGVVVVVALVVALLAVGAVAWVYNSTQQRNEADAYLNAMASDEPAVLQNFLDIYADAPIEHRDSVSARLAGLKAVDLEWANVVASGSKSAIERYLKMHPGSVHAPEGKIKIDSLDWVAATEENTPEAYQAYMDSHADGLYVDEAHNRFEKLDAQKVTPEEQQAVTSLFSGYFTSLAAADADGLTACVANVMGSFLHKANATKNDVIAHMKRLHAEPDVTLMNFRMNNDWKITKQEAADGGFEYIVAFSVDQKLEFTDPAKNAFNTYKVEGKVSPEMKISELNMKKVVQ